MEAEDCKDFLRCRSRFREQRCAKRCGVLGGARKKWMWLFLDCSKCGTRRKLVVTTMGEGGPETAGHASTSAVAQTSCKISSIHYCDTFQSLFISKKQ